MDAFDILLDWVCTGLIWSTEQASIAATPETCIRKVLGSNLGWITGYPDREFSWFSLATRSKFRDSTSIRPRPLHFKSTITHHPTIRRYVVSVVRESLNSQRTKWNSTARNVNHDEFQSSSPTRSIHQFIFPSIKMLMYTAVNQYAVSVCGKLDLHLNRITRKLSCF
jgi:hypothetical protein